jgi:hypothetical protein
MRSVIRSSRVLTLVILAACGGRSAESSASPDGQAVLQVEIQGFADMVVYAVSGGQRMRLGMATGNSTKSFVLPAPLVPDKRSAAISGRPHRRQPDPGQRRNDGAAGRHRDPHHSSA